MSLPFDANYVRLHLTDRVLYVSSAPVTNLQFASFLNACSYDEETCREYYYIQNPNRRIRWNPGMNRFEVLQGYSMHPVTHVTWAGAQAYSSFVGGRLPTVDEWTFVATNAHTTKYPWGDDDPGPERANFGEHVGDTTPVGRYEASQLGIMDLCGNVWEWTSTPDTDYRTKTSFRDRRYFIKGGGWSYSRQNLSIGTQSAIWSMSTGNAIGFRVVYDPKSGKRFKSGLIVGRFSILHNGHARLIDRAFEECEFVNVAIAKADQKYVDARTFVTPEERRRNVARIIGGRSAQIELLDDTIDSRQWVGDALSKFTHPPEVVYAGSWDELDEFQEYSGLACRVVSRQPESTGGISSTRLTHAISEGLEIGAQVPNDLAREYRELYKERLVLFSDIQDGRQCSEEFFESVENAIESLTGALDKERFELVLPDGHAGESAVQIVTNDKRSLETTADMFAGYALAGRLSPQVPQDEWKLLAYYTPTVPAVNLERIKASEISLHGNKRAWKVETESPVLVVQSVDCRRLYLWSEERKTLIAFLHSRDPSLTGDPMRLARGLLHHRLADGWIPVQAGAVSVGQQGILICGAKGKGKTTSILQLLSAAPHWRFVSNDKIWLSREGKHILGSPQALRIGVGTLYSSPQLKGIREIGGEVWDIGTEEPKIHVQPSALHSCMGVDIAPFALTKMALIVDWSDKPFAFRRATREEVRTATQDSLVFDDAIFPKWILADSEIPAKEMPDLDWYLVEGTISNQEHFASLHSKLTGILEPDLS
ncbi:MAG: SUMF1/EgtB/PvdO family nonheme iron enzyme [Dehalococcoidia bacterium]|nr:SUMF1/EgtB/PvdO family nonheme iron enzyme [Dehalococcoidia bacterium]